ncbi:DUF1801 domain-containing protein [Micromonospora phytophila]|uniref:DUF1801 domain-containing protein n=1 Tax=Micromonospora phytophila TaxID=709888 RepID=UPI00202FCAE1|nr:DUF1801 domain-containing protein [Micromonospora phytophila]MCM0673981.1 DUF1801 domain-containing protein [Micromonospora phytophila]
MATLKTAPTGASVDDFLAAVADDTRRRDAATVRDVMHRVSGEPAVIWGDAIVGFGQRRLRYASGRELDWFLVGFSPRKAATTLYLGEEFPDKERLLARLGRHSVGKGCLYVKRLADVDLDVLTELIRASVGQARTGQAGG